VQAVARGGAKLALGHAQGVSVSLNGQPFPTLAPRAKGLNGVIITPDSLEAWVGGRKGAGAYGR